MIYPNMVYENGQRGEYRICNNAKEMVLAAEDNFWPIHSTRESVLSDPDVVGEIQGQKAAVVQEKIEDKIVEAAIINEDPLPTIEEQYKSATGRTPLNAKGRWAGQETKNFKQWKEMHKENK
jgi:hypothetical protein